MIASQSAYSPKCICKSICAFGIISRQKAFVDVSRHSTHQRLYITPDCFLINMRFLYNEIFLHTSFRICRARDLDIPRKSCAAPCLVSYLLSLSVA